MFSSLAILQKHAHPKGENTLAKNDPAAPDSGNKNRLQPESLDRNNKRWSRSI